MADPDADHLVQDGAQLAALMSPARQEIVDTLSQMGTVSVTELAAALHRPPDALYYHLRALKSVGLVVHEGYRQQGKRQEELLRAVSPNLKLQYLLGDKGNFESVSAIVGAMLRMGIRDFDDAFQSGEATVDGPERDLWAFRKTGWLTEEDLRKVNVLLEDLRSAVSKPRGEGRLYALTALLTPLSRRSGDPQKS